MLAGAIPVADWGRSPPEKSDIALAMGPLAVASLPLLVTDSLGLFRQQGLNVAVLPAPSGAAAVLRAVLTGAVDVGMGRYDHTIQTQAQGQALRGVVLLNTLPGLILGVRADLADRIKTIADFKGRRIGVALPGGAADVMIGTILQTAGLTVNDVAIVGLGSGDGVLAAVERKIVDLVVDTDPVMTLLERIGKIRVTIDTRTEAGCIAAYGGRYPMLCLYALQSFIDAHPAAIQRLANAGVAGLRYLHSHSSNDLLDAIAPKYRFGDRALAAAVVDKSRAMFSRDGRFDPKALETPLRVIAAFEPKIVPAQIDLARTYTNRFVDAVPPPP